MSCCYKGCQTPPDFSCGCIKGLLVCRDHISIHLISVGNHQPTSFILSIGNNQRPAMISFIKERIDLCGKLMRHIIDISERTIRLITELSSKTLSEILQRQKRLKKTLKGFENGGTIEKDIFDEFNKGDTISNATPKFDTERFQGLLINAFNLDIIISKMREDKYAIYFDSNSANKINLLDLDTFAINTQSFQSLDSFGHCGCLKIDENKYFIIDQYINQNSPDARNRPQTVNKKNTKSNYETNPLRKSSVQGYNTNADYYVPLYSNLQKKNSKNLSAKIIDLENKTSEIFSSNIPSCESGLCLFDDEIFAFGGSKSSSYSLKFNLTQKTFARIQGLPEFNSNATSARLKNNIIVGGYNSKKIFAYNPRKNLFNDSNYCLLENHQKYIFENFIVCFDDYVYEIYENDSIYKIFQLNYSSQNRNFSSNWTGNGDISVCTSNASNGFSKMAQPLENIALLNSSACFKRNNCIHFIIKGPRLYRINITTRLVDFLDLNY